MDVRRLNAIVCQRWRYRLADGSTADLVPLPHPSGVSTWFKTELGKTLLARAVSLIASNPAWRQIIET